MDDLELDFHDAAARVLAGDGSAVDALCESIRPRLVHHVEATMPARARRLTDAEDVVQQVLSDLAATPRKFLDDEDSSRTWKLLKKRADWRVLDTLRAGRRLRGESDIGAMEPAGPAGPSTGPVTSADDRRWLRELVEFLHGRPRDVVMLCGLEGHSYASAAELLGTSPEAVRKAYERASDALRESAARRMNGGHGLTGPPRD